MNVKNENFRINDKGEMELCIGIKDKYGNLIYENDILKHDKGTVLPYNEYIRARYIDGKPVFTNPLPKEKIVYIFTGLFRKNIEEETISDVKNYFHVI